MAPAAYIKTFLLHAAKDKIINRFLEIAQIIVLQEGDSISIHNAHHHAEQHHPIVRKCAE